MSNFWQSLLQLLPPYRKLLAEIALARQETANLQATLQIVSEQANLCKLQRDVLQEEAKRLLQEKEDSQISLETVSEHADMMEEQLLETRNLLEQKVIERTRELAEKNIELQQEIRQRRRIEKAQRNNLVFLKTLLNSLPNPIFYKNLQGQFLGCNSAFERCIGLTEVQLEGLTVHELYPPIMAKEYHQRDLTLFRNQQDQIYESFVRYADGTDHYVIYHQTPFNSAEGKLAGLVGVMVDISEHRRAAEALRVSEQYSSTLIRESLIGLVLTRLEGTFVEVNPAYADILGYSVTEMLKLNYWQLSPDKYAQLEQEQRLTLETTGRYGPYEKEYIHKRVT